jgi:two-component system cell cycle sensor histidine kinase/response regulator CckA
MSDKDGDGAVATVLVVEDERVVREMLLAVLARFNYRVLVATDGLEGVELYRAHGERIDLVLLDLSMPGLSGIEVLAQLQSINPAVCVVILTGFAEDNPALAEIELVHKPFRVDELIGVIKRLIG